jgi:glycosyltransferase involved in cell wall biosynthesis
VRLTIITPEYPPHANGGIARFYGTLAPALVRAGCEVDVIVANPFSNAFPAYEHEGARVQFVAPEVINRRANDFSQFSAAPTFRRWLAAGQVAADLAADRAPDGIETTDFGLPFVPLVTSPATAPVIVHFHGSLGQISTHEPRRADIEMDLALARLTEATLLPLADGLQAAASGDAREWGQRLSRTIQVRRPPVEAGEAGSLPGSDALVVARIQSWKGPEILCQAMRRLGAMPVVRWIGRDTDSAPGGGSLDAYLRQQYPDVWGVKILPIGSRPFAEVSALQREAAFVIVPSVWDAFNYSATEAMGAARVVVCSDGAGACDLIRDGVNGFRYPANDVGALAAAMGRAFSLDRAARAEIGHQARQTVLTELDPDAIASARIESFRTLCRTPVDVRPSPADWIQDFYREHRSDRVSTAFLDQIGLRELSTYVGRRTADRLLKRAGGRER